MALPNLPPTDDGPSDHEVISMLKHAAAPRTPMERAKNFRLVGTGLNPLIVYGSALGFILLWVLGALALSMFGPIFAALATVGVCGTAAYFSLQQSRREARVAAGMCPKCGYDLRASNDRCPECGTPVPEEILRWRRLRPPLEPGMEGYVAPKFARVKPEPPSTEARLKQTP